MQLRALIARVFTTHHDDIIARCGIPGYSIRSSCIGGGIGLHWEAADEDISVASLLQPEKFMRLLRAPVDREHRFWRIVNTGSNLDVGILHRQ